jgi:hypothetical protein
MEHAADPMERTCSEHSNFGSDPIGHGHGKTEPVPGHALADEHHRPIVAKWDDLSVERLVGAQLTREACAARWSRWTEGKNPHRHLAISDSALSKAVAIDASSPG